MKEDTDKVSFDLSKLELDELIRLYNQITEFLEFLDSSKIVQEEKGEENNE